MAASHRFTDEEQAIAIARKQYAMRSSNDIEIDDRPATSTGDGGIWVAAWVWVRREQIDKAREAGGAGMRLSELRPGLPVYYGRGRELVHVVSVIATGRVRVRQEATEGVRYRTVTPRNLNARRGERE